MVINHLKVKLAKICESEVNIQYEVNSCFMNHDVSGIQFYK